MKKNTLYLIGFTILFLILITILSIKAKRKPDSNQALPTNQTTKNTSEKIDSKEVSQLQDPISNAAARTTKKFFGTKVSPGNSPISPERFSGYHTGLDFETFPDEQDSEVTISAACDGLLLEKKYASGYGGVAVQACILDNKPVTIIYGHLKIDSVIIKVGTKLKSGDKIGVLGKGYSSETDGERKHLHFGIHQGANINITGYVQNKSQLDGWLDPQKYLPKN